MSSNNSFTGFVIETSDNRDEVHYSNGKKEIFPKNADGTYTRELIIKNAQGITTFEKRVSKLSNIVGTIRTYDDKGDLEEDFLTTFLPDMQVELVHYNDAADDTALKLIKRKKGFALRKTTDDPFEWESTEYVDDKGLKTKLDSYIDGLRHTASEFNGFIEKQTTDFDTEGRVIKVDQIDDVYFFKNASQKEKIFRAYGQRFGIDFPKDIAIKRVAYLGHIQLRNFYDAKGVLLFSEMLDKDPEIGKVIDYTVYFRNQNKRGPAVTKMMFDVNTHELLDHGPAKVPTQYLRVNKEMLVVYQQNEELAPN